MKREIFTSLFWLLFAIYIAIESYRLGLGTWGMPGPGYFPFGAALFIGIISLSTLVRTLRKGPSEYVSVSFPERQWRAVVLSLVSMVGYFLLLNRLGFVLCTLLFAVFFLRVIMLKRWFYTLAAALSIALAAHLLFNVLLNAQLPRGIFAFLGM